MTTEARKHTEELKPCPFCGASPVINQRGDACGVFCNCNHTSFVQTYGGSEAEATRRWNTRTESGLVEELATAKRVITEWERDMAGTLATLQRERDKNRELLKFVSRIGRMTQDGEEVDGVEFVMENDDAVSTLNELISEARDLANGAQVAPDWQSEAERLAGQGWIINVAATPHGFCASILSERKPFEIFRCQLAPSLRLAFEECRKQMGSPKPTGPEPKAGG